MDFLTASLGLVILLVAGDSLVRGAVNLSLRLGVPALIVALTIVAFGTSAPELLISIDAVLTDVPGLALGNVIGSNTANVLLVLGVPALLKGLDTSGCDTRKDYIQMMMATVLFMALAATGGVFGFWQGVALLAALGLVLSGTFRIALAHRRQNAGAGAALAECDVPIEEEIEGADPDMPWWKVILFLAIGMIGLPLGADLLVDAATNIAHAYNVPDEVIGLTLVALGTSLPELATTVMAAFRNQADVALGNVIGSNLFNLLAIIGVASLVGPIPVDPKLLRIDMWVMLISSLILAPFVFRHWRIGRLWGAGFFLLYLVYIVSVVA
ncbi:MAG: sodium:proton exchanger [Rhodobacterales bacterium]|nr:MAG: sodium:proton exchanger [Rhodobacterales bacterium]